MNRAPETGTLERCALTRRLHATTHADLQATLEVALVDVDERAAIREMSSRIAVGRDSVREGSLAQSMGHLEKEGGPLGIPVATPALRVGDALFTSGASGIPGPSTRSLEKAEVARRPRPRKSLADPITFSGDAGFRRVEE